MKIEQLDESLIGTGHVMRKLPAPTTDKPFWVGFHGTSSLYADRIAQEGFSGRNKLLSPEDILEILKMADAVRKFPNENSGRLFRGLKIDLNDYQRRKTVNFFPLSEQALLHTKHVGGQVIHNMIRPIIDIILNCGEFVHDARVRRLAEILEELRHYETGYPVVYAVHLEGIPELHYDISKSAIQTEIVVEPARCVVKLEARGFAKHRQINKRSLDYQASLLAQKAGSKHFTAILYHADCDKTAETGNG